MEVVLSRSDARNVQEPCSYSGVSRPVHLWCSAAGLREGCSGTRLFAHRLLHIAFHETALGPRHGRAAHANARGDLLVARLGISGQENLDT